MVNAGRIISALLTFGLVDRCVAGFNGTHVTYTPAILDWENGEGHTEVHYGSIDEDHLHLYENNTLQTRGNSMSVDASVVSTTGTSILAAAALPALINYLADRITYWNQNELCTMTWGTYDELDTMTGYAWEATATGSKCRMDGLATAVKDELKKCINNLNKAGASTGCCKFKHGTLAWTGELRVTSMPEKKPAKDIKCP